MGNNHYQLQPPGLGAIRIERRGNTPPQHLNDLGIAITDALRAAPGFVRKKPVFVRFRDSIQPHPLLPGMFYSDSGYVSVRGTRITILHRPKDRRAELDAVIHEIEEVSHVVWRGLRNPVARNGQEFTEDELFMKARAAKRMKEIW